MTFSNACTVIFYDSNGKYNWFLFRFLSILAIIYTRKVSYHIHMRYAHQLVLNHHYR